jgi:hypothetical protein
MADSVQQSQSPSGQIVYGLMIVAITFVVGFVVELLYKTTATNANRFMTLMDYTAGSEDMPITIRQDLSKYPDAKPIGLSMNERTGIEFAYSFYIYVQPSTFSGEASLKHVFHKGFACPWPLMGPGVFMRGDTNTMRIFMNTYKNPYTYVDVRNIPVDKWVHVVLNCYKSGLDVFVNGNLATRLPFKDTIPYQNFQDIILFSTAHWNSFRGSSMPSIEAANNNTNETFAIDGAFRGYVSNLIYTRYALSVTEIQTLMSAGASTKMRQKSMDKPPYLADDWWANQ